MVLKIKKVRYIAAFQFIILSNAKNFQFKSGEYHSLYTWR